MIPDRELWRTAQLMIDRHGRRARAVAEGELGDLEAAGDGRVAVWRRIVGCVDALSATAPGSEREVH
jgi:hypothetical protein